MKEVVSIKFGGSGRSYYFDPEGHDFKTGENVIVETTNGVSLGAVVKEKHNVDDAEIASPLKKIVRRADKKDLARLDEIAEKETAAFKICQEKIAAHNLEMKLVRVIYSFDLTKITFFFTADGRIDFRELVKDLAAQFHTRIELRQIGVRDEARFLGGISICGQPYCCKRFLTEFQPVSIKMAKEQNLSPNPSKLSGSCGRLMCCLQYEQESYEHLRKITPSIGTTVKSQEGVGTVTDAQLISGILTVRPENDESTPYKIHRSRVRPVTPKKKRQNNSDNE